MRATHDKCSQTEEMGLCILARCPKNVQQQIEWHQAPSNTRIGLFHEAEVKITSKIGMKYHLSGWSIFETGCKGMSITSPVAPEMVTDRHTE